MVCHRHRRNGRVDRRRGNSLPSARTGKRRRTDMTTLVFMVLSLLSNSSPTTAPADAVSVDELDAQAARARRAIKTCGPVAACYCLRKSGRDVKLKDVLARAKLTDEGTSVADLLDLLSSFGMPGEVLSGEKTDLEALPFPSILLIGRSHCVVFEGLEDGGRRVRYFEPSDGSMRVVSREVMSRGRLADRSETTRFRPALRPLCTQSWLRLRG